MHIFYAYIHVHCTFMKVHDIHSCTFGIMYYVMYECMNVCHVPMYIHECHVMRTYIPGYNIHSYIHTWHTYCTYAYIHVHTHIWCTPVHVPYLICKFFTYHTLSLNCIICSLFSFCYATIFCSTTTTTTTNRISILINFNITRWKKTRRKKRYNVAVALALPSTGTW